MKDQPTPGRIVHFVLPPKVGEDATAVRPAMVVSVSPSGVSLQVFTDGENDRPRLTEADRVGYGLPVPHAVWRPNAVYAESADANTWHWPNKERTR